MSGKIFSITGLLAVLALALSACQPAPASNSSEAGLRVLAVESYLADMAQNVAGERLKVDSLIPADVEPHNFEPAPQDVAKIADAQVVIINGGGLETWINRVLENAGGKRLLVDASAGLKSRTPREGEAVMQTQESEQTDPHFWLDPQNAVHYVENIRDGLSQADPSGASAYAKNAEAYIAQLKELDQWIAQQVQQIPSDQRKIVTNHESFGYFADRYGFQIIGTVIPSVSTEASPSAQQLADLVDRIRATGARVIFLETGANSQLANQVAQEAQVKVVSDLFTHSLSGADGPAPTYIDMMKYDTTQIVNALK